ncbi:hypothetical protein AMJ87_00270 [candidate division WOR_3 bacterium SM23_60]|uniref:Uncharacterized protein n=1 Tax=candidate division WOR_3 bacterium SM23_60 TaxID=1703780 RepID=A0A0S8GQK6_UNCW3|nr:MAG: hypothetical protein AMJ87_00270 [candidate division WOR_3 bacterium SM23_60]
MFRHTLEIKCIVNEYAVICIAAVGQLVHPVSGQIIGVYCIFPAIIRGKQQYIIRQIYVAFNPRRRNKWHKRLALAIQQIQIPILIITPRDRGNNTTACIQLTDEQFRFK